MSQKCTKITSVLDPLKFYFNIFSTLPGMRYDYWIKPLLHYELCLNIFDAFLNSCVSKLWCRDKICLITYAFASVYPMGSSVKVVCTFKNYDKSSPTYSIYNTYAIIRHGTHAIASFAPCFALSTQRHDYKLKHGCWPSIYDVGILHSDWCV